MAHFTQLAAARLNPWEVSLIEMLDDLLMETHNGEDAPDDEPDTE